LRSSLPGPIFNLIFAMAAFWLMFVVGIPETRPVLGPTSGLAAEAGLKEGDLIVSIDGAAPKPGPIPCSG
jgi:regulator of sigma E protease